MGSSGQSAAPHAIRTTLARRRAESYNPPTQPAAGTVPLTPKPSRLAHLALAAVVALASTLAPALAGAQSVVTGRLVARPDSSASAGRPAAQPLADGTIRVEWGAGADQPAGSATTISRDDGRFVLAEVPAGPARLTARRLGYATLDTTVLVPPRDTLRLDLALAPNAQLLGTVLSEAERRDIESFTALPNVATTIVSAKAMAGVPSLGEPDVVRVVQLLPGVGARNDYSTGLNVRGGAADQNLVLLDGIPIYNPFHMGGVFSTFMDAMVGGIELTTGAFPSRYDGRLSSVLDVRSATEQDGFHGNADVSVLAASTRLAGSSGARGAWSIAARRTYADAVASAFSHDAFPYHFQDLQAHARYLLPHDWQLGFTAYGGDDALHLDIAAFNSDSAVSRAGSGGWKYDWGNRVAGLTLARDFTPPALRWLLGGGGRFEQRVSTSGFATKLDVGDGAQSQRSSIRDLRAAGSYTAHGARSDRAIGYEVATYRVVYRSASAATGTTDFDIVQRPTSAALWVDDVWRPTERVVVEGGVRGETLTGTDWRFVSPRLSLKYLVTPTFALTAATGRVSQYLHSLAGDGPFRFFDVWLASDRSIPVESAWHWVVGAERRVETGSVKLEAYVKHYDQVLDANVTDDPSRRGDEFLPATGLAYGVDLLARWQPRSGPTGWVSYAYGVASHDRDGFVWAPGNDRRHDLNVVAVWQRARYRFGARFGFASGTPYTPIVGEIARRAYDPSRDSWGTGNPPIYIEPLGGVRNSARFPATHRLDLDVSREMVWHGAKVSPYLSVVNAYDARNVFVYIYDYSTSAPTRRGYSQFPILPSVGVRVAF